MSKKNLLNESTIRKFMKLASIEPLASDFFTKLQETSTEEVEEGRMRGKRDEEDMREASDEELEEAKHEDADLEEAAHDDEEKVDEAAAEELEEGEHEDELGEMGGMRMDRDDEDEEMDLEMDAEEPAAGGMVSVDQLMAALEKALEDVLGQEVEVSQDDEEEAEADADLDMDDLGGDDMMEEKEIEETKAEVEIAEAVFQKVLQRLTKEK